jgi:hypothetical protein
VLKIILLFVFDDVYWEFNEIIFCIKEKLSNKFKEIIGNSHAQISAILVFEKFARAVL